MLREIRGIEQRNLRRVKRWFQDDYFDLFVWQDRLGTILEFQLCYRRDTRDERVLDWRRGRGFQHLKPDSPHAADSGTRASSSAPAAISRSTSASGRPSSSRQISRVCSPSRGAWRRYAGSVSDHSEGTFMDSSVPSLGCSTGVK